MTCPVCETAVSSDSSTCPSCGADVTTTTIEAGPDRSPRPSDRRPAWFVFGGVAAVVLALGAAAMAFTGGEPPVATATYADRIPSDAAFYFEVDVAALGSEETKSLLEAFSPLVEAQTGQPLDPESLLEEVVASLDSEFADLDLSFRDDIASWATGPVAVGILATSSHEPGTIIVVGGDDSAALDAFLTKVAAAAGHVEEVDVGGVTFQALSPHDDHQVLLARQGTDLLVASDRELAARLVDPISGETIADLPRFEQAVDILPPGAVVVFTANPQAAEAFGDLGVAPSLDPSEAGLTVGSVSVGAGELRIDYVTEFGDGPSASYEPTLLAALPAETIALFRTGPVLDQYATLTESAMLDGRTEEFEEELGFSIEELLAVFSVDGAVAVWPSTDILFPVNAALVGVSDRNQSAFVDRLVGLVESMGVMAAPIDGGYSFEGLVNIGTRDHFTFLTSDRSLIRAAPEAGFDSSDTYRRARGLVDGELVALMDVPAVIELLDGLVAADDPDTAELLSCLPVGLVAAGSTADGSLVTTSVVVEIEARC